MIKKASRLTCLTIPGSGKHSIDDWALGILCAHEKNILWKPHRRVNVFQSFGIKTIAFYISEIL